MKTLQTGLKSSLTAATNPGRLPHLSEVTIVIRLVCPSWPFSGY